MNHLDVSLMMIVWNVSLSFGILNWREINCGGSSLQVSGLKWQQILKILVEICVNSYRDATFQEISWNQEISDKNKQLQEK